MFYQACTHPSVVNAFLVEYNGELNIIAMPTSLMTTMTMAAMVTLNDT